jgi:DNA-binding GntR family transcriptional regulator
MQLPKIRKMDNSLSEIVYQAIYKNIIAGKMKPGEAITEISVANSMGISRAPVREALKRLAEDKLVVLVPRSGCYVKDMNIEEIDEIYEIRKRLECMAFEYAFEKLDRKQLNILKKKFEECLGLNTEQMLAKEIKLDSQLHSLIAQDSGCPNLEEMLENLRARIEVFRFKEANYEDRARLALKEHVEIIDAVLTEDKATAIECLKTHIAHTKENVLKNMREKTQG